MKIIKDSVVYSNEVVEGQLSGLSYLISWKSHSKDENTWETASAVIYLYKIIIIFHQDHLEKSIVISLLINSALPMAKPSAKLLAKPLTKTLKEKQG